MSEKIMMEYLGERSYKEVLSLQEAIFNQLVREKKSGESTSPMRLILCQHKPVYTLGKHGDKSNLLPHALESGAEFVHTDRGGDITFHGPGQLVGYPILDLERLNIGLAKYIERLEETVIRVVSAYGLKGERFSGASGVWLDPDDPVKIRKICALGIRSSRWVTMHGFAFNINTDLSWFDYINPCGFNDKKVTSLQKERGTEQDFGEVRRAFTREFLDVFGLGKSQSMSKIS